MPRTRATQPSLTRARIAATLQEDVEVPLRVSEKIVERLVYHICAALADGEVVKIKNFGRFHILEKKARIGRNPATGVEAPISARRVLAFRGSPELIRRINAPNATIPLGGADTAADADYCPKAP